MSTRFNLFNKNRQKEKKENQESDKITKFRKTLKLNFPDDLREQIRRELEAEQNRLRAIEQAQQMPNWRIEPVRMPMWYENVQPDAVQLGGNQFVRHANGGWVIVDNVAAPVFTEEASVEDPVEDVKFED